MVKRKTPITEPANIPLVVLCHEDERKQVSTVYQFQSIDTASQRRQGIRSLLQSPPMSILESIELLVMDVLDIELMSMLRLTSMGSDMLRQLSCERQKDSQYLRPFVPLGSLAMLQITSVVWAR